MGLPLLCYQTQPINVKYRNGVREYFTQEVGRFSDFHSLSPTAGSATDIHLIPFLVVNLLEGKQPNCIRKSPLAIIISLCSPLLMFHYCQVSGMCLTHTKDRAWTQTRF